MLIDAINPDIREDIEARLERLAREEGVRYLLAIESGSRAWGFPSPDSDYDVRFIYVRPRADYLSLSPPRDVIERPIVDEIDLNGWDIRKTLELLLKNNSVVSEWIESPIEYLPKSPIIAQIAALGSAHFDPRSYALHYANLGRSSAERWLESDEPVPVKKWFYALRPALAIRALRMDPRQRPPMQLQQLVDRTDLPSALREQIFEMVALKAETREAGLVRPVPETKALIVDELGRAQDISSRPLSPRFAAEANAIFLDLVGTP